MSTQVIVNVVDLALDGHDPEYHGSTESYEDKIARKQAQCADAIPAAWKLPKELLDSLPLPLEKGKTNLFEFDVVSRSNILTKDEIKITEAYDVATLLKMLASGELSSVNVTRAFSKRAAIAQQLTNCLTETFFDRADARARELDALRESGKLAGPLHGLPISLKDSLRVIGTQSTLGLVAFLGNCPARSNSPLVEILINLGAVPFVKTNIPQTMMTPDSHNHVFGRTLNPHNTALGAGGSSGGEGALIAFHGSPLGVGTDIAGSIRIPALCCGVYGFKPSINRIPFGGQQGCFDTGIRCVYPVAGPMAGDMNALELFCKAVIDARPSKYDSSAIYAPWREFSHDPSRKLRLGVLPADPCFPLHPSVQKTMNKAVGMLEADGHTLISLSSDECQVNSASEVAWGAFLSLDDTAIRVLAAGPEPNIPSADYITGEVEKWRRPYLTSISKYDRLGKLSILVKRKCAIQEAWRKVWLKHGLDAVISPGAQSTAVEHDMFGIPAYTTLQNILEYPACILPFGKAEACDETFTLLPGQIGPEYNSLLLEGTPCAVQVFTGSMQDEECLDVSKIIDCCINKVANGA